MSQEDPQGEDPFNKLCIAPQTFSKRSRCPKCHKSCFLYCSKCLIPIADSNPPSIDLPIHVSIAHHPQEKKEKSTALHACVLCPEKVQLCEWPDGIPPFDPNETVLLFPSEDACTLDQLDLSRIRRLVVVDSTWAKTFAVCHHPHLLPLPKVAIPSQRTLFWRHQRKSDTHLATIEAIYYFFRSYAEALHGTYRGEFDNLLWYYAYMYRRVQHEYIEDPRKRFRHIRDYIHYPAPAAPSSDPSDDTEPEVIPRQSTPDA
eukprot:gnl/Trimastix_PCT/2837.p1 GENE.gnl/Trimastix_PCT/2837~~gnl/Trimastix_PCT/2837.p1  ORF type:complete len:259 (+),score=14.76 gnl/Trimastix_PCT/2837:59-835(+)